MHKKCRKSAQKVHKKCVKSAQKSHNKCKKEQKMHKDISEDLVCNEKHRKQQQ